jgi:hypothetical protein
VTATCKGLLTFCLCDHRKAKMQASTLKVLNKYHLQESTVTECRELVFLKLLTWQHCRYRHSLSIASDGGIIDVKQLVKWELAGNRRTAAPTSTWPPQIPHDLTWVRIRGRLEGGDKPPELLHGPACYGITTDTSWTGVCVDVTAGHIIMLTSVPFTCNVVHCSFFVFHYRTLHVSGCYG